ncbi:MAG: HIT family protein [Candidatus Aenigmatarchaeota archaeon]
MPGECPFCKIVRGEEDSERVYESDDFLAILDINPSTPGHTLVIPKEHVATFPELSAETTGALFDAVQEVMKRLEGGLEPDGFNVGWNHGKAGGQAVPHLHLHVLPRFEGDKGGPVQAVVRNEPEEDISTVARRISGGGSPPKQGLEVSDPSAEVPSEEEECEEEEEDEEEDEEDQINKSAREKWKEMKKGRY